MKNALEKFFGQQSKPLHSDNAQNSSTKLESTPDEQDVNAAYQPRFGSQNQQKACFSNRGRKFNYRGQSQKGPSRNNRQTNPTDQRGNPLRCMICQLVAFCERLPTCL